MHHRFRFLVLNLLPVAAMLWWMTSASAQLPAPVEMRADPPGIGFGWSVATSDNRLVVSDGAGSSYELDGVFVFELETGNWVRKERLVAPFDGEPVDITGDDFGWSVAVSDDGSRIVVGAPSGAICDRSGANTEGPCYELVEDPYSGKDVYQPIPTWLAPIRSGTAFVFEKDAGGAWKATRLIPDEAVNNDRFGASVAISGDTILIGAPQATWNSTSSSKHGVAYVFEAGGPGAWSQTATLLAAEGRSSEKFGYSVAIDGDSCIIGSSIRARGTRAFVFNRQSGQWGNEHADGGAGVRTENQTYEGSADEYDFYGSAVGISGGKVLIGAAGTVTVAGGYNDGAAWIGSVGGNLQQLIPDDPARGAHFGWSVAISGDRALVSAPGLDGDAGQDEGAVYLFKKQADDTWDQAYKLVHPGNPGSGDRFGGNANAPEGVAISSKAALIGASNDDWDDCGLFCEREGTAFVYELPEPELPPVVFGSGFETE